MPTWCINKVTIEGESEDEIRAFKDHIVCKEHSDCGNCMKAINDGHEEYRHFSFQSITPMPNELHGTDPEEEGLNWYTWRYKHWGTKWNLLELEVVEDSSNCLEYKFVTANGVPKPICKTLRAKFPELDIIWYFHDDQDDSEGFL